ncbi:oxidation resistance protein 1-like isoform X3 [Polyodon spathula]|uniref:oxidation resistance protein 1-like isoform X3 n=1 Tax=Polyodon spathula TaxID=7913 RepID=UPI001B7E027F|nr:oxidation resistance protein 1-like isoform X3 [Polyodon spathula]
MDYLLSFTGKSSRTLREIVFNRSYPGTRETVSKGSITKDENVETADENTTVQQLTDTGQKKTPEKKDGRRMSFQKPKGTIEYSVESRDSLNNIALKFDTTPNELVQLNKLFSRAVVAGQILYVPDPEYFSSVESSPSLSPISPLSPTSSEAELEKVTDSDGVPRKEATSFPAHVCTRPARVVSSTSEEEEALTEKFLKINCKYITDGKGAVSGVLLVTPNNIMFDPHKTDPLVQEHGCEEYGIMCPIEEVMTATMYKDIVDSKIKESLPPDLEYLISGRDPCHVKRIARSNTDEMELKLQEKANDSTSTAPRSTEESLSEDVFTESELSPIREELVSSDELRQDKSSGASSESIQTINQMDAECCLAYEAGDSTKSTAEEVSANDSGFLSHTTEVEKTELELKQEENLSQSQTVDRSPAGSKRHGMGHETGTSTSKEQDSACEEDAATQCKVSDSQCSKNKEEAEKGKFISERTRDTETEVEELRKLWKSHTMQQTKEQRDNVQQTHIEVKHRPGEAVEAQGPGEGTAVYKEKRRHRSHKFLCLRVGKPMRKTFVSQASASMQQYAQRDRKHEYWFAVPQERTDHLYVFFIQWSPDMYGEGAGVLGREPGFMVVKRNEESETSEEPASEVTAKDWEVVSVAEYHRRIDALNTEELRSLCKRLKITTNNDVNSKQGPAIKTDLEPDTFKPNLSEPSELLQPRQIEKLVKHLPPRTIGYPWTLAFSTARNGMSIKTLYRTMQGQDTPVLMVIKDSDGQVFGALASEPFKVSDCFYGTGETFLFTFCPEFEATAFSGVEYSEDVARGQKRWSKLRPPRKLFCETDLRLGHNKVFKWTGDNMFFIKGDMDSLAFGGGGGEFGLWLDGDLYHGRSHSCKTFGNHTLSKKEDFYVQDIEIWSFE